MCPWLILSHTDCQNTDILTHQVVSSCCPEQPECPPLPRIPLHCRAAKGVTPGVAVGPLDLAPAALPRDILVGWSLCRASAVSARGAQLGLGVK